MEMININGEEKPVVESKEKILEFAKGLYKIAHYSKDMRKCVETAILNSMGEKRFNQVVSFFQVTKNDYIDYLCYELNLMLEKEKAYNEEQENKWREHLDGKNQ